MEHIEKIIKDLKMRVITFYPMYARLFGGMEEAIFFQQIFFWSNKGKIGNGIIYKSDTDMEKETYITTNKQYRIRKKLRELGVLDIWRQKVRGAPTNHYKINFRNLEKLILDSINLNDSSITENTTENNEFPLKEGNSPSPFKRKREYKNSVTYKITSFFSDLCKKTIGISPIITIAEHRAVTFAMNTGGLNEKQIFDLFDEWFALGKSDEETISIKRALSRHQIEGYKVRNNVRN